MQCPHDGSDLAKRTYEADIEVDRCRTCDGVWLDHGELERIQSTVERDYKAELSALPDDTVKAYQNARSTEAHAELVCPGCGAEMSEREHGYCSQIFIDVCSECRGVWLDGGELQALEVFFERSAADTSEIRRGFWTSLRDLVFAGVVPD